MTTTATSPVTPGPAETRQLILVLVVVFLMACAWGAMFASPERGHDPLSRPRSVCNCRHAGCATGQLGEVKP